MNNRYVVSGISPGPAGVGRVLEYLKSNSEKYTFLHPPIARKISFKESLIKFSVFDFVKCCLSFTRYHFRALFFRIRIYTLKNKNVVILHPQTVGYKNVKRLVLRNSASIYVMDNSFFCVKSYNYLIESERPCFLCLAMKYENAFKNSCNSFPVNYDYAEYFDFIDFIKSNIENISFITQNKGQTQLLKKQFGDHIVYTEIGLLTSDLFEVQNLWVSHNDKKYDIVFHGDNNLAKGGNYILELSKKMPEYNFLFPFKPITTEVLENVDFIEMNWTTGLKSYILDSKLTLCPSIWSAPIEGSVVKTLNLGIALGVFNSDCSFGKELPNNSVLRLSGDIVIDVELIRIFISSKEYISTAINGKKYIDKKVNEMILEYNKIFNVDF